MKLGSLLVRKLDGDHDTRHQAGEHKTTEGQGVKVHVNLLKSFAEVSVRDLSLHRTGFSMMNYLYISEY